MLKNIILATVFFTLTPLTLAITIFGLNFVTEEKELALAREKARSSQTASVNGVQVFASLPSTQPLVLGSAEAADARAELVRQYLNSYKSPLETHAEFIVQTADKYGLDFRLITAIAQQESNLCKFIPAESYNCWGWGIHSQGSLGFQSYEEGIETVSRGLREKYIDEGLLTPDEIMTKYTPSSPGSWARGVNTFMEEME